MSMSDKRHYFWILQNGVCAFCGVACRLDVAQIAPDLMTIEHIVPLAYGGWGTRDNLAGCCRMCNERRGIELQKTDRNTFRASRRAECRVLNEHRQLSGQWSTAPAPMCHTVLGDRPWTRASVTAADRIVLNVKRCAAPGCGQELRTTKRRLKQTNYCCQTCARRASRQRRAALKRLKVQ